MNGSNQKRLPNKLAKLVTTRSSQGGTPKEKAFVKIPQIYKNTSVPKSLFNKVRGHWPATS